MADVAAAAGVSVSTVSRALRGLPGVGEEQRRRIEGIAAQLSYVVSPDASRLARGGTGRIAVVLDNVDRWFFGTVLAGIERVLRAADFDVLVYHVDGEEERQRFFADLPARRKVDGVIVVALPAPAHEFARLSLMGVHVVVAGGRMGEFECVRIDDVAAARTAVSHLTGLGHRHVAMLRTRDSGGAVWPTDQARTEGYLEAMAQVGVRPEDPDALLGDQDTPLGGTHPVLTIPFGADHGWAATERLISGPHPPTAIFAHSDEIAFGCLQALRHHGWSVPQDMSVVAIDDHPLSGVMGLTTVAQPVRTQGELAAMAMLGSLGGTPVAGAGGAGGAADHVVATTLVVRGSTGRPREAGAPLGSDG
ncbi:LacI family DNA-binding transcriptional regulator [Nocardioides marmoribigeumensis]|uniref:DNA-binding LacI/PurR family transcriptional regulator n=1 Tax=Nocardioides marmoribigeumensis TaxID=433649 RepID=A0ABU2BX79_9ACTN|nr:LacI family DNA-binding transcriptional regulator [Nocardioides marmoribigeumensis]MDR7363005.1 DNA-binding LacI/PurR family transcriptional regulator [Nocardioides marmoribigeumensis]